MVIHKRLYNSILKDPNFTHEKGYNYSVYCDAPDIKALDCHTIWRQVTCDKCLQFKKEGRIGIERFPSPEIIKNVLFKEGWDKDLSLYERRRVVEVFNYVESVDKCEWLPSGSIRVHYTYQKKQWTTVIGMPK